MFLPGCKSFKMLLAPSEKLQNFQSTHVVEQKCNFLPFLKSLAKIKFECHKSGNLREVSLQRLLWAVKVSGCYFTFKYVT